MIMNVEQSVEWELAEDIEVLWENVAQRHFVHHTSHLSSNPGRRSGNPTTNSLGYVMAPDN
jgi:hypothetical protein